MSESSNHHRRSLPSLTGDTDHKLRSMFSKCTQAGATINVAAVGGSITAGWAVGEVNSYPHTVAKFLTRLCPAANIELVNAGKCSVGSLTTAMCLPEQAGAEADILFVKEHIQSFPSESSKIGL